MPAQDLEVAEIDNALLEGVLAGQRRALAKTITLLESTRADHRLRARALLNALLPHSGRAVRVGMSGVPGVGKSTFIEALGLFLIGKGHRVAVLAVDPSSSLNGGSILGDKTRMEKLACEDAAFIRPSPSGGTLGGVASRTREAMLVLEAAGFDIVIVETVGVGQSETAVAGMSDAFVLMQLPNAGDELQAIKKGIVELADLIVINKEDLDPDAAMRARAQMGSALSLLRGHGAEVPILGLSALRAEGVEAFWMALEGLIAVRREKGEFEARRRQQALAWMWALVQEGLQLRFQASEPVRLALPEVLAAVEGGKLPASVAAVRLLEISR
ncbi:methylmalonyl Co-A mutase-associated GTPase MeaB [Niveibacterium terrae]|uniref:methylmalonyl Co-A mutase-associated GTPase MeaB n=1 Tax=Niveibacterium terrae TaxID=3373598 RepID=UPI003A91343A